MSERACRRSERTRGGEITGGSTEDVRGRRSRDGEEGRAPREGEEGRAPREGEEGRAPREGEEGRAPREGEGRRQREDMKRGRILRLMVEDEAIRNHQEP